MMPAILLKHADIILFHTKGLSAISLGIRMLTNSYWNHVGVYLEDVYKKGFVVEALGRGVVKTPIEEYLDNKNYILRVVQLKPEAFKDESEHQQGISTLTRRMLEAVGQKYDWESIIWLGIKYIIKGYWHKGAKYIPQRFNPFQNRDKFFCSELVATACYGTSSISKYPNLFAGEKYQDAATTTPRDISKSPNIKHIYGNNKE